MPKRPQSIDMDWSDHSVHLRVLATSDLHANLTGYDFFQDKTSPNTGLARIASLIHKARDEAAQTLLLDNGDLVQGTPMGDWAAKSCCTVDNPFIAALNSLGYDAATLGNHDFNFGLPYISQAVTEAHFPVVVSNLSPRTGADRKVFDLAPWTVLERRVHDITGTERPLTIGILGLTPPQVVSWDKEGIGRHLTATPPLEAARKYLPEIRKAGADIVVVLCHGGIGRDSEGPENIALELAQIGGVDAIIMGHVHDQFPKASGSFPSGIDPVAGTLNGVPAVMPGAMGSHLGVVDLRLERDDRGSWHVAESQCKLRPVAKPGPDGGLLPVVPSDPGIEAISRPAEVASRSYMERVVARQDQSLHSFFAYTGRDRSMRAVTAAMRRAGRRFADTLGFSALPVLTVGSAFRCGGFSGPEHFTDTPAGNITLRDIVALYPFPDRLALLGVTGEELRLWLEHSAKAFHTVPVGSNDTVLINSDIPSYHYDVIDGLDYQIDLSQPPLSDAAPQGRIRNLTYDGRPLAPNAKFLLATNNYRAGGGGGFPGSGPDKTVLSVPDLVPDLLQAELRQSASVDNTPFWSFVPLPGTSCLLQTGHGAAKYLPEIADFAPQPLPPDQAGFAVYRLHLGQNSS